MSGLTDEQRRKIEENKQKALAKRAGKLKPNSPAKHPQSGLYSASFESRTSSSISSASRESASLSAVNRHTDSLAKASHSSLIKPVVNRNPAVRYRDASAFAVEQHTDNLAYASHSSLIKPVVVNPKQAVGYKDASVVSNRVSESVHSAPKPEKNLAERIEENRLKALAKRAEKVNTSPTEQHVPAPVISRSISTRPDACKQTTVFVGDQRNIPDQNKYTSTGPSITASSSVVHHIGLAASAKSGLGRNTVDKAIICTDTQRLMAPENSKNMFNSLIASLNNRNSSMPGGVQVQTTTTPSSAASKNMFNSSKASLNNRNSSIPGGVQVQTTTAPCSAPSRNMFTGPTFSGKPVKGNCVLVTRERFEVDIGYCVPLVQLIKNMETKLYDAVTKKWSLKLSDYNRFITAVKVLKPNVDIDPLPKAILQAFAAHIKGENSRKDVPIADLSRVHPGLVDSLMPFQREGVNFAIHKNGRVLLADDMGLGKTIQAICVACYYREQWPLLIVVPSSVRFDWAQQLQRWVPHLDPQEVRVVVTGKESCTSGLINILSYDIMARKADVLRGQQFQIIIMDECHLLKNHKTARCKAAMPLLQNARRVILLSGTPALSRPSELYTQISAVCPFFFKFHDFGVRYCDGKQQQWGWDYSGSSNMGELQLLLEEKIMIRRLKKDVLSQLPDKVRQMVLLDPGSIKVNKGLKQASKVMEKLKGMKQRGALLEFFHQSGNAKINAIKSYIDDLLEGEKKILIFAHHQEVLDAIEELVKNKINSCYMRIDGRTNSEQRHFFCKKFQQNDDVRVAILSITAANAGINLSSANLVVFAELFWNPGILVQAEDRAHRIGQQDSVIVQYLVAKGTSDDHVWPMIQRKLDVLGKAGLSKENFSSADTTKFRDQRQEDICKFLEESFSDDFDGFPEQEPDKSPEVEFDQSTTKKTTAKQTSILKYVSPQKGITSPPFTPPSTPCKENTNSSKGLFKYFSPSKAKQQIDSKTIPAPCGLSVKNNQSSKDLGRSSNVKGQGCTSAGQSCYDNELEAFLDDSDEDFGVEPEAKKRKT